MNEIEVKILEIDKKKVENGLRELEAKKIFDGIMIGRLFDTEDEELFKNQSILRLRTEKKNSTRFQTPDKCCRSAR